MKSLLTAVLIAGVFGQANALEPVSANNVTLALSKEDITAILDIKTKQHLDIAPLEIQPLIAPTELTIIARKAKSSRFQVIASKLLSDE
ncbi:hypothetical protein [Glaciecola sp. SC05]|uniref:hypothetical protein n=1 Tax=Glaciecola sp. SC05 TaxID=1987355 RepID=UPI0035273F19